MPYTPRRVVVGVSGSPGSLQALRIAVEQAHALDATLMPVIVWEPPGGDSAARPYPHYVTDGWADAAEARLLTAFEQGLGGLPSAAPTEPHVIRGRTARVLVTMADQPHDLLVIGMGHPRFPHRTGCGQVARHCLAHATCPVIAVPPTGLATAAGRTLRGLPLRHAPRDGSAVIGAEALDPADQEGHRNRLQ